MVYWDKSFIGDTEMHREFLKVLILGEESTLRNLRRQVKVF